MAPQALLQGPYIAIYYDHLNDRLLGDWHGDQDLASVRPGAMKMLRPMKLQRRHKVRNDNTRVTSMRSEAAEWGGKVWFPATTEAGLQYLAWVYPPNLYSRLFTDLMLQCTTGNPVVAIFDEIERAKAWLKLTERRCVSGGTYLLYFCLKGYVRLHSSVPASSSLWFKLLPPSLLPRLPSRTAFAPAKSSRLTPRLSS